MSAPTAGTAGREDYESTFERNAIKCPKCGLERSDDLWELHGKDWEENFEWECPSCETMIDVNPHLVIYYTAEVRDDDA